MKVTIKKRDVSQYKKGYPLIERKTFVESTCVIQEGEVIDLVSEEGQFLGRGYYGVQNKGDGWVLTQDIKQPIDSTFFEARLWASFKKRQGMFDPALTNGYRMFNGEGDGIGGVTIDVYNGFYMIQWYSEGIYSFRQQIINGLKKIPQLRGIYEKKRYKTAEQMQQTDDYVLGEVAPEPLLVKENGITFAVYLNDGPMVGVFLDQRDVRKKLASICNEKTTVLNTFSYTGAFSIFAGKNGSHTTSVDLAKRSLIRTEEHFRLNDIEPKQHKIIVDDVFQYFKYARRKKKVFDIVILDPPSFARSKKKTFSVATDYVALLDEAIALTKKGGTLIASTNYSGFDMKKFKKYIRAAFQQASIEYKIQEMYTLPEDFPFHPQYPEGNYLKVVFIQKI